MERTRSRTAHALGGAWRAWGGGVAAAWAVAVLAGTGCLSERRMTLRDVLPAGWVAAAPATQMTPAFDPRVKHLPDPTQEGVLRPGIHGQLFLLAQDGSFTDAAGDLYVMAEDITPRPPGQPPAVPEVWHFDPVALRKLKTKDERFGDCYALFLPYPANWTDVTQVRMSTQYKPKGDPEKEPVLSGPPQTLMLDFTPPGGQPEVWLKTGEQTRMTAPVSMKAMPNVARDIARGGFGTPHTGPQATTGTVPAAWQQQQPQPPMQPQTPPPGSYLPPTGGGLGTQASGVRPPPTTPTLPPSIEFTPDRPRANLTGPNGEPLTVTALALPPGQNVPAGWEEKPDGSVLPVAPASPNVPTATSTLPPVGYQPASARFRTASDRYPTQPRIQHGAFNPPPPPIYQPQTPPDSLPALPLSVQRPPTTAVPPAQPLAPVAPTNFDPASPVGAWASNPTPVAPPPPPDLGGPLAPVVPPVPPSVPAIPPLPPGPR